MKAFILLIWNMSAGQFIGSVGLLLLTWLLYESLRKALLFTTKGR